MLVCRTPRSDWATPFQVSVRFWIKAERAPEWTTVVVVVNETGPKPDQPEVFCSKPGLERRLLVWEKAGQGAREATTVVINNAEKNEKPRRRLWRDNNFTV